MSKDSEESFSDALLILDFCFELIRLKQIELYVINFIHKCMVLDGNLRHFGRKMLERFHVESHEFRMKTVAFMILRS